MITIGYCTKKENKEHQAHLLKVAGTPKVEIIEIVNEGNRSLTECYNEILEKSKYDIVLFLHDDVLIETKQIATKIDRLFNNNVEFGIIGVAGTKHLSNSGRWWDDRSSMFGKVRHTNSGKSWLSEYSGDLGKNLEEVVLVDGVFFAVKKSRLKENFDTNVKGFHFYDVDFCFRNFISGTKIGVTTEIRVNHMSIGMTNEQWEENRKAFVEKYHSELPRKIKQDFKNKKLSVLIGCLNFQGLTGSELLTLETAIGLSNEGCDVSVISNTISNDFAKKCEKNKIKLYHISQPPGFRMGDGVWQIETNQGLMVSKANTLYMVAPVNFDIIHANHKPITEQLLRLYPESKFISTIGSEIIELEEPIVDNRIKKYIAVRPTIKDYINNKFKINFEKIEIIYNPIDSKRFKPVKLNSGTDKKVTLFVGTMDYLRKNSILDLVTKCSENNKELWLVGNDTDKYGENLAKEYSHVKYFKPTDRIEEFFYKCDETAGIMLGRTTIEGFLCGKPGIVYNVDKLGNIINSEFMDVPEDLTVFDFNYNINKIKSVYIDVINMFDDKRYMFNGRIIKPDNTKNWGDLIPYEIISKIFINTNLNEEDVFNVKLPNKNYKVYSTGSVMGFTKKDSIVWGSGCIDFGVIGHKPKEIHSVRGPLTRDELIKRGIDCPEVYGDPALLYPLIYNPKIEKKYKWGLIPHYIDYESIEDRETIKHFENLGFKIIDICKGKNEFIDELLEVEYVLSSSLHGLIAADAYGLPNARVIISNKLIGGDFKFLDYYKSVNRTEDLGLVINTNTEISEILSLNNKIEIDINRLLNSSPWEVNPEIKNKIM